MVKRKTQKHKPRKGKSRKMNGFMKLMLDAKKHNKPSFVYKGKTYKKKTNAKGLIFYKK
tara:strand:+ start:741 stop:917 length:177 start_codon:yes stop_codon:yes gene_type:complete